jgi:hypothetical protein
MGIVADWGAMTTAIAKRSVGIALLVEGIVISNI